MLHETKLFSLYKEIEKINEMNGYKNQSLIRMNFQILSHLLLMGILEENKQFDKNSTYLQKSERVVELFPFIMSNPLENRFVKEYELVRSKVLTPEFMNTQDPLGELYQHIISSSKKLNRGIVFTPLSIIKYILSNLNYPTSINLKEKEKLIDLSCGSGVFLVEAINRIILKTQELGKTIDEVIDFIQNSIYGFDIDYIAVLIAKFNIILLLLKNFKSKMPLDPPIELNIFQTNSLIKTSKKDSKEIRFAKSQKYDFIVGNPPYIDVKRMDKITKSICKKYYPDVAKGKFDVYACFLKLSTEMLSQTGKLGFIIPNKFLSSQYAKSLRKEFLEKDLIQQIVDLSHKKVFQPAVYPIILTLNKSKDKENHIELVTDVEIEDLDSQSLIQKIYRIKTDIFKKTENKTIFFPNITYTLLLDKIFKESHYSLGDLIKFRWTISFHRKGLRKQFVYPERKGKNPVKFIGGKEFGGNREVERYSINWRGYWIDYDREKAKNLRNNFLDIDYFLRKKIIICQHALRIRATIDSSGFVCKDIFLIGHLTDTANKLGISLEFILGILNSKLYSFIYDIMYSGTEIMGKYLHYLPMYLHDLPVKISISETNKKLTKNVEAMLNNDSNEVKGIDDNIDQLVYNLFEITDDEMILIAEHINRFLKK